MKPKIKLKIKQTGRNSQTKKLRPPKTMSRSSKKSPIIIKKNLAAAPKNREVRFEKKTPMYLQISNPWPYDQLYLRQWEKRVLISKGIEK
ncbi:hypothetical protein KKH59_00610 [Patescibacteria group bacterium]|nr:hypothetical protein [Patescibacteria group bacterium]